MEPSEVLKKAWIVVQGANLPDAIQPVAFQEAVRLLVPSSITTAPVGGDRGKGTGAGTGSSIGWPNGKPSSDTGGIDASEDEIYDRVVEHTGVDREKLEQVVHLDGDVLKVSLPGIKLGRNNAEKTRTVAQVLTIVRGFGLNESETSVEVVRAEASRLKCYDSANFAAQLSKLVGFVITGSGTNRRIRAKAPGIQAFPGLVENLVGTE